MTTTLPSSVRPKMYLVITNISKRNNVKALLQTASSCGCAGIFVVGQRRQFDLDATALPSSLPQSLSSEHIINPGVHDSRVMTTPPVMRFEKWKDCVEHLMEQGILLVGVEIHQDAVNLEDFVRNNNNHHVAFLMGNEGQGIHEKHMTSCQAFVKIPQYGGGTASLNVNVAASIVLHSHHLMLMET
ncbi:hypothetical protein MHU86_4304 [Fragilaria crotonensis]|nr:hypothetical protein MHU86_4304 [Fragilaria crotonensis]